MPNARHILRKVPEITLYFWLIKLLTTAMGEATSDYFVSQFNPVPIVLLSGVGLVLALILQFSIKRYIPWIYWLTVVMVAIFGTMLADVLHIGLGVPYIVSTICFAISLALIFFLWYTYEKTLSIHSITTIRREIFYWATVMATFALGTAAGDLTANSMHLGYFSSGIAFAILIALPALVYWRLKVNTIAVFWIAYILTRPLGASFADWVGKTQAVGGLGVGDGIVSLMLSLLIILFVGYLTSQRKRVSV